MSDKGKLQRLLEKPMSEGKFWTDRLHLVSGWLNRVFARNG